MTRYIPDEWIEKHWKTYGHLKLSDLLRKWADAEDECEALEKLYKITKDPVKNKELYFEINGLGDCIVDLKQGVLIRTEQLLPASQEPKPSIRRKKVK